MHVKTPEHEKLSSRNIWMTHAERKAWKETVRDHPTITTYGGILKAFLNGEAIKFHEVDPRGSQEFLHVKVYLDDATHQLFDEAYMADGMTAPEWVRFNFFGLSRNRKNAAKDPLEKDRKITFQLTDKELKSFQYAKATDGDIGSNHQWVKTIVLNYVAKVAREEYEKQLADNTNISK